MITPAACGHAEKLCIWYCMYFLHVLMVNRVNDLVGNAFLCMFYQKHFGVSLLFILPYHFLHKR